VRAFFAWCETLGLSLHQIEPLVVASYIEKHPASAPTVKQHLAAIRCLFDWLVVGQVIAVNPAASVKGPKYVTRTEKTPVLEGEQARTLLESIETGAIKGLRDRALIGVMVYSFGRIGAVVGLRGADYFQNGKRWWLRLHEKGGKRIEIPVHHKAEEYLDAYLKAAGIADDAKGFIFRSVDRSGNLTSSRLDPDNALMMVKARAIAAGLPESTCCHTFRATGITAFLSNGGALENAQYIAGHASASTTKLYDRRNDKIALAEIEKIVL
jgi:site-specific recombinase XerD